MKTTTNKFGTTIAIGEEVQVGVFTVIVEEIEFDWDCGDCFFLPYCDDAIPVLIGHCSSGMRTDNKAINFKLKQ